MKTKTTERGFRWLSHPPYIEGEGDEWLVAESTAIDFEQLDAPENPGSSYLWIGKDHHLNRAQVRELIDKMSHWLEHKRLPE